MIPAATVRTRVRVPLRFPDGYSATAEVVTFDGLADGREHLALVFGDPATSERAARGREFPDSARGTQRCARYPAQGPDRVCVAGG